MNFIKRKRKPRGNRFLTFTQQRGNFFLIKESGWTFATFYVYLSLTPDHFKHSIKITVYVASFLIVKHLKRRVRLLQF